ncbi:phosphotransferase [Nocardia sp. NPDC058176]|uniref:phosphotransferase n=1 Tax=Nocardia sp. NPDC058176 TaxID=3346368 RepID=UPI0036DAB767
MEISEGWDSVATVVEDRWIERRPRRPEVADQLLREVRLMPWLAPLLPLAVPVPWVVSDDPLIVRHTLVPGRAIDAPGVEHGRVVGAFLRALHDSPPADAIQRGLPSAEVTRRTRDAEIGRFRTEVIPLLPVAHQDSATAILDAVREFPADTVVHGDLGPEHVLVNDGSVAGVIDFGDMHLGDPANDLAWPLFGTPAPFATAVADAYGLTDELHRRALVWHRLGPWYEVTYGLDIDDPATVRSGIAGLLDRLASPAG